MHLVLTTLSLLSNLFVLIVFGNYIAVKFKWTSSGPDTGMAFMVGMIMVGVPLTLLSLLYTFKWSNYPLAQIMAVVSASCVIAWLVWGRIDPL
jgi:hypothetical protein